MLGMEFSSERAVVNSASGHEAAPGPELGFMIARKVVFGWERAAVKRGFQRVGGEG